MSSYIEDLFSLKGQVKLYFLEKLALDNHFLIRKKKVKVLKK